MVTIIVGHTADTLRATDTDGGITTTACIIGHITELTLLSDTLLTPVTIAIDLAANTANTVTIVDADRRLPATARIGAKDTELALIGHTLAQARLVTLTIVCTFNTDSSPTEVCTHRGLSTAACTIGYITGLTAAGNALA